MSSRWCTILCFIAGISIASGSWYNNTDWALRYPNSKTFMCPSNLPITSVYSEFNQNTSQREWKFACNWNRTKYLNIISSSSWSNYVNEFQKDLTFSCVQHGESHFIFGVNVLYSPKLADGRWRFGCSRLAPSYRLKNCTYVSASVGKLQQIFEYTATNNNTFVTGFASKYDIGLKDRTWDLVYCELGNVRCDKPPQPEGVLVTYDSLQYGSTIKYMCQNSYSYVPEETGLCDKYGRWTISPPDCQPCAKIPYCSNVLCTSVNLNSTICLECQNVTDDGLPLTTTVDLERCEAKPMITNSMPKVITFDIYDLVILHCNATGYPKPRITWLHNSRVVSESDRILLLTNGSLVLRALPSDVGLYICTASSNDRTVSINVTLKQRKSEPPVIVDWTNIFYFPLKKSAQIPCKAVGDPQPNIIWYKDGNPLQHKGKIRILKNGTLFIKKVKERDSGRYRCKAENKIDWVARETFVHVYGKHDVQQHKIPEDPNELFSPIIRHWKLLIIAYTNSQVVLPCNSFGNPKPNIRWLKAAPYGDKIVKENDRIFIHPNGSLVITNVSYSDRGQYSCRASNSRGIVKKHLLISVKSSITTAVTPTMVATTKEASINSTPTSISTSEILPAPTNSSMSVTDPYLPTTASCAPTRTIYWLILSTFSLCTVLSLL